MTFTKTDAAKQLGPRINVVTREYDGIVDGVSEGIAFVTLVDDGGTTHVARCRVDVLQAAGVLGLGKFQLLVVEVGDTITSRFVAAEPTYLPPDDLMRDIRQIERELDGDGHAADSAS